VRKSSNIGDDMELNEENDFQSIHFTFSFERHYSNILPSTSIKIFLSVDGNEINQ
jgi:hypothetical protein